MLVETHLNNIHAQRPIVLKFISNSIPENEVEGPTIIIEVIEARSEEKLGVRSELKEV